MNGPTKTVGPPWTPLPARKSKGVLEKVLDDADAVIDGNCPFSYWNLSFLAFHAFLRRSRLSSDGTSLKASPTQLVAVTSALE